MFSQQLGGGEADIQTLTSRHAGRQTVKGKSDGQTDKNRTEVRSRETVSGRGKREREKGSDGWREEQRREFTTPLVSLS